MLVLFQLGSELSYSVSDVCDPNPAVRIVNVTSNEGVSAPFDATHTCLTSERNGNGTGRVYTITLAATDASGNVTLKTVTVTVPHEEAPTSCSTPVFLTESDPRCQF
jgi:hypothetical protein